MNFRPIALWCVLFSLLAHVAGDVNASPLQASVCETQSLIAGMTDHANASVCDLQHALKTSGRAPLPTQPDSDGAYQATLTSPIVMAPQGYPCAVPGHGLLVEVNVPLVLNRVTAGMSLLVYNPASGCPLSHQIAPNAPPRLS